MIQFPTRRKRARGLAVALVVLSVVATVFYYVQNSSLGRGGSVAGVKVLWLLTVIVYWYLLSLFWATDRSLTVKVKMACTVFAANMLLRAAVELWMMYVTDNWLHAYGIGHDIASVLLCLVLALYLRKDEIWALAYFFYCALLFALEALFASYLRHVTNADGSVFFLPSTPEHEAVMIATAAAVGVSAMVGLVLIRKWLYAAPSFKNSNP